MRASAVKISRPDKVLIPPDITKAGLAAYYAAVAPAMLPHIARRPLNFERYPDGIERHRIFQQHASGHFPDWVARVEVPSKDGKVQHVMARDAATLVYLAGQACITFHSWLSRSDKLNRPDRLVIDLDPSAEDPEAVRRAALSIGALLRTGARAVGDDERLARLSRGRAVAASPRVRRCARIRPRRGRAGRRA